ncbi:MAG: hypothetical protein C3F13_04855 [Anaerolineales bacterium]|nr:carboxypeptidase regulatory-like domain-containing protein [Anaerolineae bacterium]PWB55053.1 MAG: hypothetical protein C3F13_04855 [Anaerolineales bacterium]
MKRWLAISLVILGLLLGLQHVKIPRASAASLNIADIYRSQHTNATETSPLNVIYGIAVPVTPNAASTSFSDGNQLFEVTNRPIISQASYSPVYSSGVSKITSSFLHTPTFLMDSKIPHQVGISLAGNSQFNLSEPIILTGLLKDLTTGAPIPNKTVSFTTNGIILGQTHTDDQGGFQIELRKDLPAGSYVVTGIFKGAHLLNPASNIITFKILPAFVRIQTVPAIPGITFQMDGQAFVSGADGIASVAINQAGVYRLDVLLDKYKNPSQRVEFGRWSVESYQPFRDVQVPSDNVIQVGINIYHKVNFKFLDLDNYPVDLSRISSISIRSVQGDVFALKPGDTPWLPASRTARRQNGLQETDLLYSVNSVVIDGSNVVNSSQQRFFAKLDDTWNISLLLFTLNISVKDGLFASPIGKTVSLTYPNGQSENFELDNAGNLTIHTLARGIYHVSLKGIKGLGTSTPVALSRNQSVNMRIITPLDAAVTGLTGMGIALGLIFYGRPWLLGNIVRKKRFSFRKSMDVRS